MTQSVQSVEKNYFQTVENRYIAENNRRAYELLLRIQSQQEANAVSMVTTKRGSA